MWPALRRFMDVVPPSSVEDMRGSSRIVLHCFVPGCANCNDFEPYRHSFEEERFGHTGITPWDCSDEGKRALALNVGVNALPSYVVIPSFASKDKVAVVDIR